MPLINVKHASPLSADQVDELIASLTAAYVETTQARPEAVQVLIEQVTPDRWGIGGTSLQRRTR